MTAPRYIATGHGVGRLTFLGITAKGLALCRCDCGALEEVKPSLIGDPLKKLSIVRARKLKLLRCSSCQKTADYIRAMKITIKPPDTSKRPAARPATKLQDL